MNKRVSVGALFLVTLALEPCLADPIGEVDQRFSLQRSADPTGLIATFDRNGRIDEKGAFFQSLGTNKRSCATCHVINQAMSLSAQDIRARFSQTDGRDPLFASIDGANCPNARPESASDHSLLLKHGLIRVPLTLPSDAEFSISVVRDPYGCAIVANPDGGNPLISVYRRPLPATNLTFLSAIMFDARETKSPLNSGATFLANLTADLTQQALDATMIHAQAARAPTDAQLRDIVQFELGLFTAQAHDAKAGSLRADGGGGGPIELAGQLYYPGINDSLGADPDGTAFNPAATTLFAAWADVGSDGGDYREELRDAARRAIAAGETLFTSAPLQISNVRGLNDNAALGKPSTFTGTCTTCHDTPNVGNHSFPLALDIGTGHSVLPSTESDPAIVAGLAALSMPDLPVYLINGCANPFDPKQPESFYTTDRARR